MKAVCRQGRLGLNRGMCVWGGGGGGWGVPPAAQMGCFAQQEWEPTRGRPAVRGKGTNGRDNTGRSRAPGPHAHGNTARQVMDGLWTEAHGQQTQSTDPGNNQHNLSTPNGTPCHIQHSPGTPTTGLREHGNNTS